MWYPYVFKNSPVCCDPHNQRLSCSQWSSNRFFFFFLEFPCFFYDPANVRNLISGSSAFSKSSLYIWTFSLLKPVTVWITTNSEKFLKEMRIPDNLTCLLRNLHAGQEATVRTGHGTMDWLQTGKGVHQGYILSPCLFNLCRAPHVKCWAGWSTSWNQDFWEKYK